MELLDLLRHQLDFYFSKENLAVDAFLVNQMNIDKMVPIDVIVSFKRVQQLTNDTHDIIDAVKLCKNCTIDPSNTFIKATPQATRNTLILRDLNSETTETDIYDVFNSADSPAKNHVISVAPEANDTWYVVLSDESVTQQTAEWCVFDAPQINGQQIHARVKNETVLRGVYAGAGYMRGGEVSQPQYSPAQHYDDQRFNYSPQPYIPYQQYNTPYNNTSPHPNNKSVGGKKQYPSHSPRTKPHTRKSIDQSQSHNNNNTHNQYNSSYDRTFSEVTSDNGSVSTKQKVTKKKFNKIHVPVTHSQIVQLQPQINDINSTQSFPALPDTNGVKTSSSNDTMNDTNTINGKPIDSINNTFTVNRGVSGDSLDYAPHTNDINSTPHDSNDNGTAYDFTKSSSIFGKYDVNALNANNDTTFNNTAPLNTTPLSTTKSSATRAMSFAAALTSLTADEIARRARVVEEAKKAKQALIDAEKRGLGDAEKNKHRENKEQEIDDRTNKLSINSESNNNSTTNTDRQKYRPNSDRSRKSLSNTPSHADQQNDKQSKRFDRYRDDMNNQRQSHTPTVQPVKTPSWAELIAAKAAANNTNTNTTTSNTAAHANGHTTSNELHTAPSTSVDTSVASTDDGARDDRLSHISNADTAASWRRGE